MCWGGQWHFKPLVWQPLKRQVKLSTASLFRRGFLISSWNVLKKTQTVTERSWADELVSNKAPNSYAEEVEVGQNKLQRCSESGGWYSENPWRSCARQGCEVGRRASAAPVWRRQCQGDGDRAGGSGAGSWRQGERPAPSELRRAGT